MLNLNQVKLDTYASLISNEIQELILFPTEQCNFRCIYCYEDFKLKRMSPDIIQGIKLFLNNRASKIKHLKINWFGGEPLIAKDIILDISHHAQKLSEEYNLSYFSGMTTNGFLLSPSTFRELVKVGITSYQISLDGPKDTHDLTRVKVNGEGTFETIWSNLLNIRCSNQNNIEIILRIHLTRDNLEYMNDFMLNLKREFIGDPRFKIYLMPVGRLGGPNDNKLNLINKDEKENIIQQLKLLLYGDSPQTNELIPPEICYASKPNSIAIRSDGSLAKCTVALNDERNKIGNINLDGTLTIDQSRLAPWLRGLITLDYLSLACPKKHVPQLKK
ncbi:radical SAM protein [Bacillus cereus]|nr:radical SAM protein [Bacillus cereus]MED3312908.1 radical SAM protein [Bacillus thuringiensis]